MKNAKKTGEDIEVGLSPDHLKRILRELNYGGKDSKTTRVISEIGGAGG
jgi:hypothetical protein